MNSYARTAAALFLALAGAQASAEAQTKTKRANDRNMLTVEEVRASSAATAYELIQSKRPRWLSTRGHSTLRTRPGKDIVTGTPVELPVDAEIVVYVDNIRNGSQDVLRSMSLETVESIEYLDAMTATQRFGTNHEYGAILVRRRSS